jgi:hypothetical protein
MRIGAKGDSQNVSRGGQSGSPPYLRPHGSVWLVRRQVTDLRGRAVMLGPGLRFHPRRLYSSGVSGENPLDVQQRSSPSFARFRWRTTALAMSCPLERRGCGARVERNRSDDDRCVLHSVIAKQIDDCGQTARQRSLTKRGMW